MDIVGCRFGRLTVTAFSHKNSVGRFYWSCQCSCGGSVVTSGTALRTGVAKSCGCLVKETTRALHKETEITTGDVYGRLTVTDFSHTNKQGRLFWDCRCECGNLCTVAGTRMRTGATVSCGCARKGVYSTHGLSTSAEYSSWIAMLHRCNNPQRTSYAAYGGRGIKVCKRWLKFESFLADMGERPAGKSIERRNNMRGYTPTNCYWATVKEQSQNRRNSVRLTYKGETLTMTAWAEKRGVPPSTLGWRRQQGWNDTDIINGRN